MKDRGPGGTHYFQSVFPVFKKAGLGSYPILEPQPYAIPNSHPLAEGSPYFPTTRLALKANSAPFKSLVIFKSNRGNMQCPSKTANNTNQRRAVGPQATCPPAPVQRGSAQHWEGGLQLIKRSCIDRFDPHTFHYVVFMRFHLFIASGTVCLVYICLCFLLYSLFKKQWSL